MGEAIITRRGAVKKGEYIYALIHVIYPAGYQCTCTRTSPSATLTAPNTSGTYVFRVPSSGEWTITATKSGLKKTEKVNIKTEGQNVRVDLTTVDSSILFDNGNQNVEFTGGWTAKGYTVSSDIMNDVLPESMGTNQANIAPTAKTIVCQVISDPWRLVPTSNPIYHDYAIIGTNNLIDVSGKSYLKFHVTNVVLEEGAELAIDDESFIELGISTQKAEIDRHSNPERVAYASAPQTYTVNLANLTGGYYVYVYAQSATVDEDIITSVTVDKVWME